MTRRALQELLDHSAKVYPDRTAIEEAGEGRLTYRELSELSDRLRDRLFSLGLGPGERAGIYVRKSIDAVVAIFGILKTGAAYVPLDPGAPAARNAYILNDCAVKVAVVEESLEARLRDEMAQIGSLPGLFVLRGAGGGLPMREALEREQQRDPAASSPTVISDPDDLAYVLYTSGSTGKPKGVMLSHRNAMSFVDWCSEIFDPVPVDRFSSHAPLHFDLSVLDIFVAIKHGAVLVLIGEEIGKDPLRLAPLISAKKISIWYSAPSILSLLTQYGNLERYDYSRLRLVLFAGEVFPIKHLRALKSAIPRPRYFNLYGPTETNVCTFYEIPSQIPEGRTEPFPIGKSCAHLQTVVVDDDGGTVASGQEGELCVKGVAVMKGYWNLPEQSARAFLEDPSGELWYRTGDVVIEETDGNCRFIGRRDRMVKRRGYRVELGEIEACLYGHPGIREVAAVPISDHEGAVRIKAFLSCGGDKRPSIVQLKNFCAQHLPLYMIPDLFSFRDALPKTSTGKTDYQRLKEMD
ncbi:MAG: amino acid adenylation domain-containing protein [Deltaproteobacteria bacterium]|nr:amino acid adenylation domain-containing protein [Deltaproteobacteria bacterium]